MNWIVLILCALSVMLLCVIVAFAIALAIAFVEEDRNEGGLL